MFNLFWFVGVRHLQLKPIRTLLTTLGVSFGIALFMAIQIINQSTLNSFKENIEGVSGKATLVVSAGESGFPENKYDVIRKVPGVKSAVPVIEARAYFAQKPGESETLMILGVDLLKEQSVRTYKTADEDMIDDPLVFLNQPDSIVITHSFAQAHGLKIGSTFSLATVKGQQVFTVRGRLSPEGPAQAYGGSIAIMDIDGARAVFGKEGKLDRVDVVTQPQVNIEEVGQTLRRILGSGYQVERPEFQTQEMERMVKSYQTMMSFFSSLALLVGLFLISNSISIGVAERRKEIGTLRALGARRLSILILFLTEALVMGVVGALAGAVMGRLLAASLVKVVVNAMSSQYLMHVEVSRLQFGFQEILRAVAIGGSAALIAAAWPALRATSIQPLEAMRNRGVKEGGKLGAYKLSSYFGLFLLCFVSISSGLKWSLQFPFLESANQLFSILGSTLVGPSIVTFWVKVFRKMTISWGGTVCRLAQDNLIRNPRRTGSNVMSLMVGLILVILIAAVNTSFRKNLSDWFERILKSDLIVSSNGKVISYQAQPLHEELGRELENIEGVRKGPKIGAYGLRFVHLKYAGESIALKAYDEPDPSLKYSTLDVLDRPSAEAGYELYHSKKPVLLVSENFALHFKKKTGDDLDIETPSGLVRFKIIGVLVDFASSKGVLYLDRALYKSIWKDPLVNAFGLQLMPDADPETVRKTIDRQLGQAKNLLVTSNRELKKQMVETLDQSFASTYAIEVAALLVGMLGLLNTLLISVMERMRELGMLRAIGMSRGQVYRMILIEALFQGGFGALAAVLLGSWLAYIWVTNNLSHVLGWIIHFNFPWVATLTTVLTGLAVALIAGYFPARRAANLEITEALEYE